MFNLIKSISRFMAYFSGAIFLLLAFFITIDTISRQAGGPYTGMSDQVASFFMALGGTWSLSYGLINNAHVKIDIFNSRYSDFVNKVFGIICLLFLSVFTVILFKESVGIAMDSYEINALVPQSMIDFPLAVPQFLASFGFFIFMLQSILFTYYAIISFNKKDKK